MSDTLAGRYAGFICDLDGVVYRGATAVAHAVDSLSAQRAAGRPVSYATNNAARPPEQVAEHLRSLGLELEVTDVVNSAQAGARRTAELVPAGSRVLAVGGLGVRQALQESGLVPVSAGDLEKAREEGEYSEPVAAVLQGFGPDVSWHDLAQAAFAVQEGATWVATNDDSTLPLADGLAPGNGSLVLAVRAAAGTDPVVVGKPHPPLYEYCAEALGLEQSDVLALGDRLNTDIAGAVNTGIDSLYVTTGVSSPVDVALADANERPTFVAMDLRALDEEYVPAEVTQEVTGGTSWRATCGQAWAQWDGALSTSEGGTANERLRVLVAAVWAARDSGEQITEADLDGVDTWIEQGE